MDPSYPDLTQAPDFGSGGHTPVVVSTVYTTVFPSLLPHGPSRMTQEEPSGTAAGVSPTPTLPLPSGEASGLVGGVPPQTQQGELPEEQFLVRTVLLSNMTVIHNAIENFKDEMERKLTKAYRHAYVVRRYRREARPRRRVGRVIRAALEEEQSEDEEEEDHLEGGGGGEEDGETANERAREGREDDGGGGGGGGGGGEEEGRGESQWPRVRIHNIRSSLPEPEIEMIYTVSRGEST